MGNRIQRRNSVLKEGNNQKIPGLIHEFTYKNRFKIQKKR